MIYMILLQYSTQRKINKNRSKHIWVKVHKHICLEITHLLSHFKGKQVNQNVL